MAHDAPLPDAASFSQELSRGEVERIYGPLSRLMHFREGFFPGSQVVSFEGRHVAVVKSQRYVACEKSDGTRYLLYVQSGKPYLIDRKFRAFSPRLYFPRPQSFSAQRGVLWHDGTVLDGELVVDRKPGGGFERCFLIYDACVINGVSIMGAPLLDRLQAVRDHVLDPREQLRLSTPHGPEAIAKEPVRLVLKTMYPVSALRHLFRSVLPALPHENDGLIFTPMDSPYTPGTDFRLLKWKPLHMHTVDFMAHVESRGVPPVPRVQLLVNRNGAPESYGWLGISRAQLNEITGGRPRALEGKVVECSFDPEGETEWPPADPTTWLGGSTTPGVWRYMRQRPDKATPNELRTVRSVVQSQRDNVTEESLCDALLGPDTEGGAAAAAASSAASVSAAAAAAASSVAPPAAVSAGRAGAAEGALLAARGYADASCGDAQGAVAASGSGAAAHEGAGAGAGAGAVDDVDDDDDDDDMPAKRPRFGGDGAGL